MADRRVRARVHGLARSLYTRLLPEALDEAMTGQDGDGDEADAHRERLFRAACLDTAYAAYEAAVAFEMVRLQRGGDHEDDAARDLAVVELRGMLSYPLSDGDDVAEDERN